METVFLKVLNMSVTAGWIIAAIILIRFLMRKTPKWIHCSLWAIAGARLICPFSIESIFSLLPSAEPIDTGTFITRPYIDTGFSVVDNQINDYLGDHYCEGVTVPANHFSNILNILAVIWLTGIAVMLIYSIISYAKLHRSVKSSLRIKENVYYCDNISAPFILGILHPKIYLPSDISEEYMYYVVAHEKSHLKRKDHWWKPLGFALLSVYWFHPLIWAAYVFFCRDIELACDERVIRDMGSDVKKAYSEALLSCSVPRRMIMACPLAFGEIGIKDRIKSVLRYKKPAFWVIAAAIIICIAVTIGFLTNPVSSVKLEKDYRIAAGSVRYIVIETETQNYQITSDTAIEYTANLLNDVLISRYPISRNRSEDRDKSNSITVFYEQTSAAYYFNEGCTQVWMDDYVKPSLTYKVNHPEILLGFFDSKIEKAADRGTSITDTGGADAPKNIYTCYSYTESADPLFPEIRLSQKDNSCQFFFSSLLSYFFDGTYELTDTALRLQDKNGTQTYCFDVKTENGKNVFIFDAEKSSHIPKLKYNGPNTEPISSVPDGAVFR